MISGTKKFTELSFISLGSQIHFTLLCRYYLIVITLKRKSTLNNPKYLCALSEQRKQRNGGIKVSGLKTLFTGDNLLRIPRIQM